MDSGENSDAIGACTFSPQRGLDVPRRCAEPCDNYGLPTDEVLELALSAFAEAERAGERIVVHCAAGMGRTGLLSSAWLCRRYGLGIDEAIAEDCQSAWRVGANRDPLEAGPDSRRVLTLALREASHAT